MDNTTQNRRLFIASCIALLVTAMTFAIRAGILSQLGQDFALTDSQLGWVNAMAFLGFPVATLLGGLLYNTLGAKKLLIIAFSFHLLGLILTITATGFLGLLISTFFIGFANGAVEAGCNPLITSLYPKQKTTMLNRFHVWFPGGIVVGALCSQFMTELGFNWQNQVAIMILPTLVYGVMVFKVAFPRNEEKAANTKPLSTLENCKALMSPLFIFMLICMTLTATTELATQQWIERILGASGVSPMLIMAMITGVMALGRYFAGPIVKRLNPLGVLLASAILAFVGISLMSKATGIHVYFAALCFALGVTYFWPTMLGFVAEKMPETGALGLSVMGGAGMFAVSIWNPIIGHWIDQAKANAATATTSQNIDLIAGQSVLSSLSIFPLVLVASFGLLWITTRKKSITEPSQAESIS